MPIHELDPKQRALATSPLDSKIFLSGPAGCGKTSAGAARLEYLLQQGVTAENILVLLPQRTLKEPYQAILTSPQTEAGGQVSLLTIGGLAQRMVDLFWPLAVEAAGFSHPDRAPVFLTLETAQYYMAHLVQPLLEEGYFESISIDRNRLYSQILDNLNKSAAVGFPYTEIGKRLEAAWSGDPAQRHIYADAQSCASKFREFCLAHNLLDFSLQLEVFREYLWSQPAVQDFLKKTYRHLIYDNAEEDIPYAHDMVAEWLPDLDSALIIFDDDSGFRRFLGADPHTGWALQEQCTQHVTLDETFVCSKKIIRLTDALTQALSPSPAPRPKKRKKTWGDTLIFSEARFYPEMLDWVADEIHQLTTTGLPASEIVVLAPYLSDALRFSLMSRLEARGVPARSHRPSRSLRDEPAAQCLLTLAALAHPDWEIHPPRYDLAYAFILALNADLVRAQLLAEIVYRVREGSLSSFEQIKADIQERITFVIGNRYTVLRNWLETYRASHSLPLDHFLRHLFGEVLSQPGFGFHRNLDASRVAASLVESSQKFRLAMEPAWEMAGETKDLNNDTNNPSPANQIGKEYITMLQDGVIAAQYIQSWQMTTQEAVLIAPAYTFLMSNRPVSMQFWLDPGSESWHERIYQPLTQPYVLSRMWPAGQLWTDVEEVTAAQDALTRLVTGLLRRCRTRLYLGLSELGESGSEQRGALLRAFQRVLRNYPHE